MEKMFSDVPLGTLFDGKRVVGVLFLMNELYVFDLL